MHPSWRNVTCGGILLALAATIAHADVPQVVTIQGRLTDTAGVVIPTGPQLVRFNIYSDSVGGTSIWSSAIRQINVVDGLFSYNLGDTVALPDNLFDDTARWLGIKVGVDPEMTPRIKLTSGTYTYRALRADTAARADEVHWNNITGTPPGFADGVDDNTVYTAGSGLQLVGTTFLISNVTSTHIQNGTILDADISNSANISPSKINGTAATLGGSNVFSGTGNQFQNGLLVGTSGNLVLEDNTLDFRRSGAQRWRFTETATTGLRLFQVYTDGGSLLNQVRLEVENNGTVKIGDSTFRANSDGISIGNLAPHSTYLMRLDRRYNTTASRYGMYIRQDNAGTGSLYGIYCFTEAATAGAGGLVRAIQGEAWSDASTRYGVRGEAEGQNTSITTGTSYGIYGLAYDGAQARGVYGNASSATTNWAGYFFGNVNVTGSVVKSAGISRIDHPTDPANKYLQHTALESPDMLNVYSGTVTLDGNGSAIVLLPEYSEMINRDFRYQLTAIGTAMPELHIAATINGNQFQIAGGKADGEVSWQVTGVRQDVWAEANRTQVEIDKPDDEKGLYLHYEEYGQPLEMSVDSDALIEAREQRAERGAIE